MPTQWSLFIWEAQGGSPREHPESPKYTVSAALSSGTKTKCNGGNWKMAWWALERHGRGVAVGGRSRQASCKVEQSRSPCAYVRLTVVRSKGEKVCVWSHQKGPLCWESFSSFKSLHTTPQNIYWYNTANYILRCIIQDSLGWLMAMLVFLKNFSGPWSSTVCWRWN